MKRSIASCSRSSPGGRAGDAGAEPHAARHRGFGGAFNEQGWAALSLLSTAERDTLMRALFDPEQVCTSTMHDGRAPLGVEVEVAGRRHGVELPAESFGTLLIPRS